MKIYNMCRSYLIFVYFFSVCYIFFGLVMPAGNASNEAPASKYNELKTSVEDTFKAETQNIEKIKDQLNQVQQLKENTLPVLETLKIQYPIYNNQLLLPDSPVKNLEKTFLDIQTSLKDMGLRLNELSLKHDELIKLRSQTDDLIHLTEKQLLEINKSKKNNREARAIARQFEPLIGSLQTKRNLLEDIFRIYAELIPALDENKNKYTALFEKFDQVIKEKKRQELLERKIFFVSMGLKQIHSDAKQIIDQLQSIPTKEFWSDEFAFIQIPGELSIVSFILFFIIIQFLMLKGRQYLLSLKDHPMFMERYWNRLAIIVVQRSFILFGLAMFFYIYSQSGTIQTKPLLVSFSVNLMLIWLFTNWVKDALHIYCLCDKPVISAKLASYFRILIVLIRIFAIFYIFFSWIHSDSSSIIISGRLAFEICLYIWNIKFWNIHLLNCQSGETKLSSRQSAVVSILKFFTYAIVISGFMLELTGYGSLAQYMFTSWGQSTVVIIWGMIIFLMLREWNSANKELKTEAADGSPIPINSIRWIIVKLFMLGWFGSLVILLVLSWGGRQRIFLGIFHILKHPIQVGSMRFSLIGFIIAFLVLLLTQGISRIWRHVFRENILKQSGMEEGFQDSITTISIYVIWLFGILFSLNALGFNSTSLTVALGALGIGLGFGLQNIFNNFISGIILLFERPIQIGDDIEVNGTWARVTKINVRSTVVQTYDNASLIIPNSDLISSQVTNWSFKDKRLRRSIEVGVAYGSDIELVRQILLGVAEKTPKVLRIPEPEVIFKDFGDSALIFRLRFWTRIEYFYAVETDIRFAIDRRFREKNIEIAFPQRDIHIRSHVDSSKEKVTIQPQIHTDEHR